MIRTTLALLFLAVFLAMLAVTIYASMDRSVFKVGPELTSDPWFRATLADAYFGFLTFYVWVAYKEVRVWKKLIWLVLIMTLGNLAMSVYVLIQLARLRPKQPVASILLRNES